MDPLLRAAQRDAKDTLQEAQSLLKRGRKVLDQNTRDTIERAIKELKSCDGPSSELRAKTKELQQLLNKHLAFARKGKVREYVESIGFAVIVALSIRAFIFEPFKIPSPSMVPTLEVGDRLYVSKARYGIRIPFTSNYLVQWKQPQIGDIVVFEFPRREALTRDRIGQWMQYLETIDGPLPNNLESAQERMPRQTQRAELQHDAWGTALQYNVHANNTAYELRSAGPDKKFNTADDITQESVKASFVAFPDLRRPKEQDRLARCPIDADSLHTPKAYIKRIVGLPGDTVEIKENKLAINGQVVERKMLSKQSAQPTRAGTITPTLHEETLPNGPNYTVRTLFENEQFGPITVPQGQFFALGDNRDESSDARCWGFTPIENIRGQAKFVLFSVSPKQGFDRSRFLAPLK